MLTPYEFIILEKASRELDALVAEKIMGWDKGYDPEPWIMLPPEGSTGRKEGRVYSVPFYSTDIVAAMSVFEKLQRIHEMIEISWVLPGFQENNGMSVEFSKNTQWLVLK